MNNCFKWHAPMEIRNCAVCFEPLGPGRYGLEILDFECPADRDYNGCGVWLCIECVDDMHRLVHDNKDKD